LKKKPTKVSSSSDEVKPSREVKSILKKKPTKVSSSSEEPVKIKVERKSSSSPVARKIKLQPITRRKIAREDSD
jgi:hypothetical protein